MTWPSVDWGLPRAADDRLITTALELLEQIHGDGGQEEEDE
jgi:hypothetical protein